MPATACVAELEAAAWVAKAHCPAGRQRAHLSQRKRKAIRRLRKPAYARSRGSWSLVHMILIGVRGSSARATNDLVNRNAAVFGRVAIDVGVRACGEAGIGVAKVFSDLVDRASCVDEERCGRVAKVVCTEVGRATRASAGLASFVTHASGCVAGEAWIGTPKGGDPNAPTPVLATKVASAAVWEHE